jgi:7,8-dihydropterin-6-yl-methyl-4-(beta-D-ribofuranosyl)aminobenzene 5'-phosphate synthase
VLFSKGPHAVGKRFTWTGEIPVEKPVAYGVTDVRTGALYVPEKGPLSGAPPVDRHYYRMRSPRAGEHDSPLPKYYAGRECLCRYRRTALRTASPLKLINLMKFLREIKPEKTVDATARDDGADRGLRINIAFPGIHSF